MNNEEKILEMLEKMNRTVEQHGEMLEKMSQTIERHGEVLEKHGEILERLQIDVSGIKVRLDTEVRTQFNLLAEGQQTIIETMTPKDRSDELEADVVVLKTAVKMLSQEVAELKKAQ